MSPSPDSVARKRIGIVLYHDFETLDVFGPVRVWGRLTGYELLMVTKSGDAARSSQGPTTLTDHSFATAPQLDVLMVPGGMGSRREIGNPDMLAFFRRQSADAIWTVSVCTGSALLAEAGLLDGRRATTNKAAYAWATGRSAAVDWQPKARWVCDRPFLTSSGVSAGIDMTLSLVATLEGREEARRVAERAEYRWNDDPDDDPFAVSSTT